MNTDIVSMTRAAGTRDEVRNAIRRRRDTPTEEQYIDKGAFGWVPAEPRTIQVGSSVVKIWKVHRAGLQLRDIKGADLYYELGDRKFVLIQYKTPNTRRRVLLDEEQLDELHEACPVDCPPSNRFNCGAWYALHSPTQQSYFPACEAKAIFGVAKSRAASLFINGLTESQFQEDFGRCRIGARVVPIDIDSYRELAISEDRVFFHAQNESA